MHNATPEAIKAGMGALYNQIRDAAKRDNKDIQSSESKLFFMQDKFNKIFFQNKEIPTIKINSFDDQKPTIENFKASKDTVFCLVCHEWDRPLSYELLYKSPDGKIISETIDYTSIPGMVKSQIDPGVPMTVETFAQKLINKQRDEKPNINYASLRKELPHPPKKIQ